MRLFGFHIRRAGKPVLARSHVSGAGGWYPYVREPYVGAWQRNDEWTVDTVLAHPTVYACVNLIASDIAKMRTKLVELRHEPDLWVETESPAFSPVLRRPNHYQTAAQFRKWWIISRLVHGNTYVLLERDGRGVVDRMYILDPNRVHPVVTDFGDVFYEISQDNLNGLTTDRTLSAIPASDIIHDRTPLFHPLVGVSPLYAAGGPANIGLTVQRNSSTYFNTDANPPGILTGPDIITVEKAREYVARWHARRPGEIAALGNGLKYEPMHRSAQDAQSVQHLNWSAKDVAAAFRVPDFMVGAAPVPAQNNAEILTRMYYTTCLQDHVHDMETSLDQGLGLAEQKIEGRRLGIALHIAALLQMDTATQYTTLATAVRGGFMTPNEARETVDLVPLTGGDTVYLQHQDYPIEQIYERDDLTPAPTPALPPAQETKALPPGRGDDDDGERAAAFARHVDLRARTLRIKAIA